MKTVFLAGPMRGMERSYSLGWRKEAEKMLSQHFVVLSPLRGREDRETIPDPRGAVIRDKRDIMVADIVLVDDTQETASMIGTAMEVHFAHSRNKVVVIFGLAHERDYWLNYHSHIRSTDLREACKLLRDIYAA